jgi:hypothetical protein
LFIDEFLLLSFELFEELSWEVSSGGIQEEII